MRGVNRKAKGLKRYLPEGNVKNIYLEMPREKESFNDSIMSNFLADKEIIRWESQFFEHKNEYFWTLLVECRKSIPHIEIQKKESSKDENYKDIFQKMTGRCLKYCGNCGLNGARTKAYHLISSVPKCSWLTSLSCAGRRYFSPRL